MGLPHLTGGHSEHGREDIECRQGVHCTLLHVVQNKSTIAIECISQLRCLGDSPQYHRKGNHLFLDQVRFVENFHR